MSKMIISDIYYCITYYIPYIMNLGYENKFKLILSSLKFHKLNLVYVYFETDYPSLSKVVSKC